MRTHIDTTRWQHEHTKHTAATNTKLTSAFKDWELAASAAKYCPKEMAANMHIITNKALTLFVMGTQKKCLRFSSSASSPKAFEMMATMLPGRLDVNGATWSRPAVSSPAASNPPCRPDRKLFVTGDRILDAKPEEPNWAGSRGVTSSAWTSAIPGALRTETPAVKNWSTLGALSTFPSSDMVLFSVVEVCGGLEGDLENQLLELIVIALDN